MVELLNSSMEVENRYDVLLSALNELGQGCVIADGSRLLYVNDRVCEISGYTAPELLALSSPVEIVSPGQRKALADQLRMRLAGEPAPEHYETTIDRKDGERVDVEVAVKRFPSAEGPQVIALVRDISERKRADQALRTSERLLADAQALTRVGSWYVDLPSLKIVWSDELYRICGLPLGAELSYEMFLRMVFPGDRALVDGAIKRAAQGESFQIEYRIARADGEVRWINVLGDSTRDERNGEVVAIFGTVQDVTERRRAEQVLKRQRRQLQILSRRLLDAQERERRHVARELHDQIGQLLTGLKLALENADRTLSARSLARGREIVGELMRRVRQMSLDLRPPMLDDLGLSPALVWLCRRAADEGLEVHIRQRGLHRRFNPELEVAVYRLVQEALTNVVRHAKVTEAWVGVEAGSRWIVVDVKDRGAGFDPRSTPAFTGGLLGMEERAADLGGRVEVRSTAGSGTNVRAKLPVESSSHK